MKKNIKIEILINKMIKKAVIKVKPEKVILFGSYAYGKPHKNSDVDLLFVKETKLSGIARYCWIANEIEHLLPIEILVKTSSEIAKRLEMGDSFYKEIMKKGKIIYESVQ